MINDSENGMKNGLKMSSTSSMERLPSMVRSKVFEKLDVDSIRNARMVCRDWNEEILGWGAIPVTVDELDPGNARFLSRLGLIGHGRVVSLKCDREARDRELVHIMRRVSLTNRVGASVMRQIFEGKRLQVLYLKERFIYQGFNPTSFLKSPPMISQTLKELRFLLPFLGRPPIKLNDKLNKDMSLLLNNILCPNLSLLEIKEKENEMFKMSHTSLGLYQYRERERAWENEREWDRDRDREQYHRERAVNFEHCWDYNAIRSFLRKHSKTLKRISLSPLRSFALPDPSHGRSHGPAHVPKFPVKLDLLRLDITTLQPNGDWHFWDEFLSSQKTLQGIRLDLKAVNFHLPEGAEVVWPPRSMSTFTQVNSETLAHISITVSGCKLNHNWRDQPFIDCQIFKSCSNLRSLILTRKFIDGESYRTFGFPQLTSIEALPTSLKKLRLKNVMLSAEGFPFLANLKQIEQIHWTTVPRVAFVYVTPGTLAKIFNLRQLNSLCFPISMEAYDLLLDHREICNIFHGAETGMGTGDVEIQDILP